MGINKKSIEYIVMKAYGSFFIISSLVSIWVSIFHGRQHGYSAIPIIDWLWDSIKYSLGIFVGFCLIKVNPERIPARSLMKFFGSITLILGLLFLFLSHWIFFIIAAFGGITYWLFRDASVKLMFNEQAQEYKKGFSKFHSRLNRKKRHFK